MSAARRAPHSALAGALQELDRRTRTMRPRRRAADLTRPEPDPAGPQGPPPHVLPRVVPAAVVVTDEESRTVWQYPTPFGLSPVVTAVVEGDGLVLAVLEEVTARAVTVRVWSLAPRRALAGPGVRVHLTASAPS
ncbi:hypothetical protein AB0D24_04545 [Streptomyces javensis]|uniref:hypothetical protein n=1 Tax=Streptomyces javensis TaxID=114698 RepID=UPI0033E52659